jgi:hypothetical protein
MKANFSIKSSSAVLPPVEAAAPASGRRVRLLRHTVNAVFCGFFLLWLSRVDTDRLWQAVAGMQTRYIFFFALSYVVGYWAYAQKYRILFAHAQGLKPADFFHLTTASSYANFIVPGSGEVLKIGILKRQGRVPSAQTAVLLVAERVFALLVLLMLVLVIMPFFDTAADLRPLALAAAAAMAVVTAAILLALRYQRPMRRIVERLCRRIPLDMFRRIDLSAIDDPQLKARLLNARTILALTLFSLIKFVMEGFRLYFTLQTLGYPLAYLNCLAANIIINFIIMLPIVPGSFGTFEFVSVSILHYGFKVPLEINLLEIFLERIFSTVLLFVLGTVGLNRLAVFMAPARKAADEPPAPESPERR